MKKRNGFTLVELLAVIIILAVILAITLPSISSLIETARQNAFKNNIKLIIKTIDIKRSIDTNYIVENLNRDNMETDLEVDNDNYQSISATINENNQIDIDAIGQNEWDGLEIRGTKNNLVVGPESGGSGETSCGGPNDEVLTTEYTATEITYEYSSATNELVLNNYSDGYGTLNLTFSFPFAGQNYSTLYVSSNGYVTFSSAKASDYANTPLNQGFPIITPWWSDLSINKIAVPSSGIFYSLGTESDKEYVLIEFRDIIIEGGSADNAADFEVKLYDDGLIKMSYQDTNVNYAACDYGNCASVGIHSDSGYYQYSYNGSTLLHDNMTISYTSISHMSKPAVSPDACFTFDSGTGTITGYDEMNPLCPSSFIIPTTISGVPVQHIGASAFEESGTRNIIIPNGLTTIGNYAFNSDNITCLVLPNSVTTIGEGAFWTNPLSNLTLSNSLTSIGDYAFYQNWLLSELTIPSSVVSIGMDAFYQSTLSNLTFVSPSNLTTIGEGAFDLNQLTSVTIPDSVTTIGYGAFRGNQLTSVTIPDSVITIDQYAFDNNQLTSIQIPSYVTTMGNYAFRNNQLTNLTFASPSSLTTIGAGIFNNNLLPDNQAFIYARNLDTSIDNAKLISYGGAKKSNVLIPNTVTIIGDEAFKNTYLESVTLPNGVTTIGKYAFSSNLLTSITFPNTLTTINESAFQSNQITSLNVPSSVTEMKNYSFSSNTQLTSITMGSSTTVVGRIFGNTSFPTAYSAGGAGTYIGVPAGPWTKQ